MNSASGPLAVLTLVIVSKIVWQKVDEHMLKKSTNSNDIDKEKIYLSVKKLDNLFSKIWMIIFLPLLFCLIGNEIDFGKINPKTLGLQLVALTIAIFFRLISSFVSFYFDKNLCIKEKIFLCITWIPKATVQAAVGSIALDLAKLYQLPTQIPNDVIFSNRKSSQSLNFLINIFKILNIAVLSILATAPIGTILISLSAGKLLQSEQSSAGSSA